MACIKFGLQLFLNGLQLRQEDFLQRLRPQWEHSAISRTLENVGGFQKLKCQRFIANWIIYIYIYVYMLILQAPVKPIILGFQEAQIKFKGKLCWWIRKGSRKLLEISGLMIVEIMHPCIIRCNLTAIWGHDIPAALTATTMVFELAPWTFWITWQWGHWCGTLLGFLVYPGKMVECAWFPFFYQLI